MATGKEIKRLRGKKVTAAKAAALIGVGVDKLRKWEERDTDPSDSGDIQRVEDYFGQKLSQLNQIKSFDFVETPRGTSDFRDKYIASLERENERIQRDLDVNLSELKDNILLIRAMSETTQELLISILAKQSKKDLDSIAGDVGKANGEKFRKLKEVDKFVYVDK
jgi:transcriptional regulator with XRE-family HTH domain